MTSNKKINKQLDNSNQNLDDILNTTQKQTNENPTMIKTLGKKLKNINITTDGISYAITGLYTTGIGSLVIYHSAKTLYKLQETPEIESPILYAIPLLLIAASAVGVIGMGVFLKKAINGDNSYMQEYLKMYEEPYITNSDNKN